MKELNEVEGTTFIFSTHDPKVMSRAGRLVELIDGRVADDRVPHAADRALAHNVTTTQA